MRTRRALTLPALAIVFALALAACGGSDSNGGPKVPDAAASGELPDVEVWNVSEQASQPFSDLLPAEKPVLVWAWAPHCPACAREAPAMVEFAEANAGAVDIVGLGTQDDAEMAAEFVDRHGIEFTMLWDESFETWTALGLTSQPAAILFSADGEVLGSWSGPMPESEVAALLA